MAKAEVTIIYVPDDGTTHSVSAFRHGGSWRYSAWIIRPESELAPTLAEALEEGCTVIDRRVEANLHTPGMGRATPIVIVYKGVDLQYGVDAMKVLHEAILKS